MTTGESFVNYWIHNEWLMVDGKKMSKSLGNFYTLRDLISKGYSALDFKFFTYSAHYRQQINFTLSALDAAREGLGSLRKGVLMIRQGGLAAKGVSYEEAKNVMPIITEHRDAFRNAYENDLNMPQAVAVVFELIKKVKAGTATFSSEDYLALDRLIGEFDQVLGLSLDQLVPVSIPDQIQVLARAREELRRNKEWAQADEIRAKIEKHGFEIQDTKDGFLLTPLARRSMS